jgi:UDP-N-acetylglucosamine diphosphorylase / glucose-1-phosphate thymidylyltransferase / UDP-N-acetylgalactosamine diphosphorylase / glucosamine-1-phosphate N-acetyltransferase / galactosamine-1-phosphate N-acetyltransferase
MDLICLAAGAGTRMGRLGGYLQKCMYPVGLRPFLAHALGQVLASDAVDPARDRLALVVGHLAEQVRGYFGGAVDGLPIVYVEQAERLGTGHALALAAGALRPTAPVIGWQADLFPTTAMVDAVARHPAPNVVTLGPGHEGESDRLRATVEGDRVARVWDGDGDLFDVGLWKLAPAVLGRMTEVRAEKGEYRMLPNLQRSLDDGAEVGYVVADAWIHLGGTLPTAEANVRDVVRRVWAASDALAAARAADAVSSGRGGFGGGDATGESGGAERGAEGTALPAGKRKVSTEGRHPCGFREAEPLAFPEGEGT